MIKEITKEFIDGKLILTNQTGVKQEITKEQAIAIREMYANQKKRAEESIARIDKDISKLT